MKIINRYLGYCIIQNGDRYTVMSRRYPNESRAFDTLPDAQAYFDKLIEPFLIAQANAPHWD